MKLNLDSEVEMSVTLGGKDYEVRPLKVKEQLELQKKVHGQDTDAPEYIEEVLKTLSKCGIPHKEIMDLDAPQLESLVEFLSKKK